MVKIFLIWLNFPFSRVLEQALEEQALPRLHLVLVGVSLSFKNRADFFSFLWFIFIDYGKSKNRNNFFLIIAFFYELKAQQTNPLQAQQPQQATSNLENIASAVTLPQIYGDERDAIIAKWNQLQAAWGTGKGIYNPRGSVEFTPDNPYCRFKVRLENY